MMVEKMDNEKVELKAAASVVLMVEMMGSDMAGKEVLKEAVP